MSDNKNKSTKKVSYQEILRSEFLKCATSPVYFMKHYVKIQHPIRGTINFNLFKFQEDTLKSFHDYKFNIILKSRQMGISTLVAAYSLWLMIFHDDKNILLVSLRQEDAKDVITKVRFANENLPTWLKRRCTEDNRLSLKFVNGSSIKAASTTKKSGVGQALSLLIIDEAALIDDAEELWTSAQPTLSCLDKSQLILTENGLIRLEQLINNNTKLGFNDLNLKIHDGNNVVDASSFYMSDKSDLYKITFESGGQLIATENHPLMTSTGWKTVKSLEEHKDSVLCKYNQNIFGNPIMYDLDIDSKYQALDICYLAGLYIANGKSSKKNIEIKNNNININKYLSSFEFKYNVDGYLYTECESIKKLLQYIGCFGTKYTKRIPDKILNASKKEQISFLQGIFDSDQCILKEDEIILKSFSYELLLNIRTVLLNFGIKCNIYSKKANKCELHIDTINAYLFNSIIGFKLKDELYISNITYLSEDINKQNILEFYDKIKSICYFDHDYSYDLKVPSSERFTCEGYINHNTGGNAIILSCVTSDTMVFTSDGIKQIGDFVNNSKIGGYEIEKYGVLGVDKIRYGTLFHNNGKQPTRIIKSKFSELECTNNHKLWAYKKSTQRYNWYKSEELEYGDYISIQYGKRIWGSNDNITDEFNQLPLIETSFLSKSLMSELCYLFGLYITSDNIVKEFYKENSHVDELITLTCKYDISSILNTLNLQYVCLDKIHYAITNKNLVKFMQYLGFELQNEKNKHIPSRLLSISEKYIISILKGVFDSNKCFVNNNRILTLSSKKLINQIRILLSNLGILTIVTNTSDTFNLEIADESILKFNTLFKLQNNNNNNNNNNDTIVALSCFETSHENIIWCPITSIEMSENETFDFSLPDDNNDDWCHSVIYNGIIGHQTPRGVGNWFHKMWQDAEDNSNGNIGSNGFHPIKLPWNLHPERNEEWRKIEGAKQGNPKKAAQEFDCDFLASGDNVVELSIIEFYKKNISKEPLEIRGVDRGLWLWEHANYSHSYIVCLPTGEYVLTNSGIKKIETITYNDKLIDRNGYHTNIVDIKTRPYNGKIYEIIPFNTFRSTKFTDEHPILVSQNSKLNDDKYLIHNFEFVDAKQVRVNDWICFPNIYNTKYNNCCDLYTIWNQIKSSTIQQNNNPLLDKDFWWIIGTWLANGFILKYNNEGIDIILSDKLNNTAKNKLTDILSKLNNNLNEILTFFETYFQTNGDEKHISECIKYIDNQFKQELINGFININKIYINSNIQLKSSSLKLMEDVQDILFSIGYISSLSLNDTGDDFKKTYILNINDFNYNDIKNNHNIELNNNCYLSNDCKWIYIKIQNIRELDYSGLVYNFTTLTGTFLCRNITTHNCADVARGDGGDFSACHVIDITDTPTQVAEYKGTLGTKDYGNFLVALATEYNNSLLVVERENVGWATIQQVIDRQYSNTFYSSSDLKYVDVQRQLINRWDMEQKRLVPGFSTNMKTRPLIINNIEMYMRERAIQIFSKRTLYEFDTFIWKNGKAQAMDGYNDDLIISLGIGLWVRDTALKLRQEGIELTKLSLDKINKSTPTIDPIYRQPHMLPGSQYWQMSTKKLPGGQSDIEDIRWLIN